MNRITHTQKNGHSQGKDTTIYSTELLMDYEKIAINGLGDTISGGSFDDTLVGRGGNTFTGYGGSDLFVMAYGVIAGAAGIVASTVTDFTIGEDVIGLFDLGVDETNFFTRVSQAVVGGDLVVSVDGSEVATLQGVDEELGAEEGFMFLNRNLITDTATIEDDYIYGTTSADNLAADTGGDTVAGLEGDDTLRGNEGDDSLFGGDGQDVMAGNEGNDVLYGGADNDRMFGGAHDDELFGGDGDDLLDGGWGSDVLNGGDGADTFQWRDIGESIHGAGRDVVVDFDAGVDQIDLSALMTGLSFVGVGGVELYTGTAGEVRFNDLYSRLYLDADGDGSSDFSVDLTDVFTLTVGDLIL